MFFLLLPKNGHKINLLLGKHDSASSFWLIIAFAKWGFSPGAAQKGPEAFPPPSMPKRILGKSVPLAGGVPVPGSW